MSTDLGILDDPTVDITDHSQIPRPPKQKTAPILNDEPQKTAAPLPIRYQAFQTLRQAGFNKSETAQALQYSRSNATILERKLAPRYDLTSVSFQRLASQAIKRILRGETWGEIEKIKDNTALAAAGMVVDRAQPIVQQLDIRSQVINISDEELDKRIRALLGESGV